MSISNWLKILSTFQKGIHHLAHNRSWADDCDLNHNVVEAFRTIAWQRRHLRSALHLKQPNSVGLLKSFINLGVILRKLRQLHPVTVMPGDKFDAVFEHRHHSQSQQIDFHQAEVSAIFLVPLHYNTSRHAGWLERYDRAELSLTDNHTAGVLTKMTREILYSERKVEEF